MRRLSRIGHLRRWPRAVRRTARWLPAAIVGGALVLGLTVVLSAPAMRGDVPWAVGQPSPRDVIAPQSITYVDTVRTAAERERAASSVIEQLKPIDPVVAGRQAQRARDVLAHVGLVRSDPYSTVEEKLAQLAQIPELASTPAPRLESLLTMPEADFQQVMREVPIVVAQTLRQAIRPESLDTVRASVIANVDRAMDPVTAALVATVAASFVVPNTSVDVAKTEAAREAASAAVLPVERSIATGQTVVRRGDILTEEDLNALRQLGLMQLEPPWFQVLGAFWLVLTTVGVAAALLLRLRPELARRPRRLAVMAALLLLYAAGAAVVVPGHLVLAYAYPAAAAAMGLTVLFGLETGLATAIVMAVALGALAGNDLALGAYVLIGSIAGSVVLARVERLASFLASGLAVAVTTTTLLLADRLAAGGTDLQGFVELLAASAGQAVLATALAALTVMAAGWLFGITTSMQLLELARPDSALLRDLQRQAPGTYQHSIVLANLAESGAAAIGADVLLTRVGAYYHDVGKSLRPYFFIENQMGGVNPHDGLDPLTSARIVISHVTDGASLARHARLPEIVEDFIWQHHGTTRAEYFYHRALEAGGETPVDDAPFRYPGPRPQFREAAIVMLADGAEAAVRAAGSDALADVDQLVGALFDRRLRSGQLDDSALTLSDLSRIRSAFVSVLQSMYHPRIRYPAEVLSADAPAEATTA